MTNMHECRLSLILSNFKWFLSLFFPFCCFVQFNPDTGKPFVWVTLDNSIRGQPMKRAFIAYHTTKAAYEAVKYFEGEEFRMFILCLKIYKA
jgi:hypothetical protein